MSKKDKFGAEAGSLAFKVHAVLTKKVKSAAKIQETIGCKAKINNYLDRLVKKGLVAKSAKGYKLK